MTGFDVFVLLVVLFSALTGFVGGFIKDTFSLFSWLGAILLSTLLFPQAQVIMGGVFKQSIVANGAAIIGIFILSFLLLQLLSAMGLSMLSDSRGGLIDKLLGLAFGIFKGVVIASTVHLVVSLWSDKEPNTHGATYGITSTGSGYLRSWVEDSVEIFRDLFAKSKEKAKEMDENGVFDGAKEALNQGREVISEEEFNTQ